MLWTFTHVGGLVKFHRIFHRLIDLTRLRCAGGEPGRVGDHDLTAVH